MVHAYESENYYDDIFTQDYLVYQLEYIKDDVLGAIGNAVHNKEEMRKMDEGIKGSCRFKKL